MLENKTHRLRAVEPTDAQQLHRIENKSDEWWLGSNLAPFSRATLQHYSAGRHDLWKDLQLRMMIEVKEDNDRSIGAVDLYQLDPRNRRAGVGIVIEELGEVHHDDHQLGVHHDDPPPLLHDVLKAHEHDRDDNEASQQQSFLWW